MVDPLKIHKKRDRQRGYSLLIAIIAINLVAVGMLAVRALWETKIQRDLEEELIFRAGQYVYAIELYRKKNNNLSPRDFDKLIEKKFLRKKFKDPLSTTGKWDIVMQSTTPGEKLLLVVPEELVPSYLNKGVIIGVCSTANEDSYREYRKKKKYNEWAFYVGDDENKEMPQLKFVTAK